MTYRSRGRSNIEVFLAVALAGFLVGFVLVLCIGNYFRAKRAQERQRERRLERLAAHADKGDDTRSRISNLHDSASTTSAISEQHQRLIDKTLKFQQMQSSSTNAPQRRRGSNGFNGESAKNSQHEFLLSV